MSYEFIGNCVELGLHPTFHDMVGNARDISRRTFLRYVDRDRMRALETELGYEHHPARGLTMAADWHVSYHRSTFDGRPCVYFRWSAYEYIFTPARSR